jgi:hypothetical protein
MTSPHGLMYWVAQLPLFHRRPAPPAPRRASRPTLSYYTPAPVTQSVSAPTAYPPLQVGRTRRDLSTLIDRMNREYAASKHPDRAKHATLQMHREGRV